MKIEIPKKKVQAQTIKKEELKEQVEDVRTKNPNYFANYVKPYIPFECKIKPKHIYSLELHRCKYTEELRDLTIRYEKAVHKKDRED